MATLNINELPDYMKDPNVVLSDDAEWANGAPPDYSQVNQLYEKEKTKSHPKGSLEEIVSNLVKNWEREASHKKNPEDLRTAKVSPQFKFGSNGRLVDPMKLAEIGTYNALIGESEYYSSKRVPKSSESHHIFRSALTRGFAWECLEVYSGPPVVAFKWRHWGYIDGELRCPMRNGKELVVQPKGQKVEIFAVSIATLDQDLKIIGLETYWNPDDFFRDIVKADESDEIL